MRTCLYFTLSESWYWPRTSPGCLLNSPHHLQFADRAQELNSALTQQYKSLRKGHVWQETTTGHHLTSNWEITAGTHWSGTSGPTSTLFFPFLGVLIIACWKHHSWCQACESSSSPSPEKTQKLNPIYLNLHGWNLTKMQSPWCCYDPALLLTRPIKKTHKPAHSS